MKCNLIHALFSIAIAFALVGTGQALAGTINIVERESLAALGLSVVSLAAGDSVDETDSQTAATGAFDFSHADDVAVTTGAGSATASGSLTVADMVSQPTAGSLIVHAERSASIEATASAGNTSTGSGADAANSVRVRFDVVGDDVTYNLTGFFDPGADNPDTIFDHGSIQLYRPFTTFVPINITTAGPVNETGTLPAGFTYELLIQIGDTASAGGAKLLQSDSSSFNLTFSIVPEPTSIALLASTGLLLTFYIRQQKL